MFNNYGGNYSNPYQGFNPMGNNYQQRLEVIRVNGENGARAFNLPPNSSVLLLDETAPLVWLAQTDGAGYKTVTPYSIAPYQAEPTPDYNSLEARIKKLEKIFNEQPDNAEIKS